MTKRSRKVSPLDEARARVFMAQEAREGYEEMILELAAAGYTIDLYGGELAALRAALKDALRAKSVPEKGVEPPSLRWAA